MRDMEGDRGQLGLRNVLAAGAVGVLSFFAVLFFGVPGLDPALWNEVTVASGLRPPATIFPGIWRVLTGWIFTLFGMSGAIGILQFVGAAVAGISTMLVLLITRITLSLLIRTSHPYDVWEKRIAPFFSLVAAVLFGVCDPLWRIARVFSPDELRLRLFLGIVYLSLRWFTVGGRWRLFPVVTLMGVMAAETPFGFALPLVFVGAYAAVWFCVVDGLFPQPEKLPEPSKLPKWRMFFLFLGGIALTAWINTSYFSVLGGVKANGWNPGYVYFLYGASYWQVLTGAASLIAWILGIGFCVVPLLVAIRIVPGLCRDDRQMSFASGALLFFVGFVALMQSGVWQGTRFWLFARDVVQVHSGFLLIFFVTCAIVTVGLFGAVFTFECQRTYIAVLEEEDAIPQPGILLRGLVPFLSVCVLVLAVVGIPKPVETEMQRIVDDAVSEIVRECEDAKWLFTDGRLDAGLEIEAARVGKTLYPLNMMSGASAWEVTLCKRGFEPDSADAKAAETGVPVLLRLWAGEKPHGMDEVALQLGFEFWKREQKALPKGSGMVAREKWTDNASIEKGIRASEEISKRILALSPSLDYADPTPAMASAFSAVSWRLSRFARYRSDEKLANDLDLTNRALKRMLSAIEYERMRTFMQLTPKEGLQIALKRANFAEATRYASAVLSYDEDDPEANFGLGMAALIGNRFKDAEHYLTRCLKRRPDEPAVLNNLSIICRKQYKYKEAEEYARHAIKVLPNSPEVKQTLEDALKKAP